MISRWNNFCGSKAVIKIDDVTVARVALGCISDVGINPLSLNRRIKYVDY